MLRLLKHLLRAVCIALLLAGVCLSGDFSDGIDKGDGFGFGDDLKGKPNTSFHKAKARNAMKKGEAVTGDGGGDLNYGSVVNSDVDGDVTIIIDDDGPKTIISE